LDQALVLIEILRFEARVVPPPIVGGKLIGLLDCAGQKSAAKGAVGDEADAKLAAHR
jgi:hypothetical protein